MKLPVNFKILTIFLFFAVSCNNNPGISELQTQVFDDIKNKLESQNENIEAHSLEITHVSGNEYIGILETLENGQNFSYNVNIIFDGNSFVWEIPPSVPVENQVDYGNTEGDHNYTNNEEEKSDNYREEDNRNMMEAMKNISDPTYCSLCKGTGIEENRARGMGLGDDEYGRVCPMCNGTGKRSY